jgi:hypothetical protein
VLIIFISRRKTYSITPQIIKKQKKTLPTCGQVAEILLYFFYAEPAELIAVSIYKGPIVKRSQQSKPPMNFWLKLYIGAIVKKSQLCEAQPRPTFSRLCLQNTPQPEWSIKQAQNAEPNAPLNL